MSIDRSPLPVTIVDPRHRFSPTEGMVERIAARPWRVDVDLLLADGGPAATCLTPDDADWLELRVGDIVGVEAVPTLPCSETPPRAPALVSA